MSPDNFSALTFPVLRDETSEHIMQEARTRGHAAGYAAGTAQARIDAAIEKDVADQAAVRAAARADQQVREMVSVLNAAVAAAGAQTVPVLDSLELQLAAAAVEIAEVIIGRELEGSESSALAALHRALNPNVPAPVHTIRLNPEDLDALQEKHRVGVNAELVADPSLARGDALAMYPDGFLDARLSTAVQRIKLAIGGAA